MIEKEKMSIKLMQVELTWSKTAQEKNHTGVSFCNMELFPTIEEGIEHVVELVGKFPNQIYYLDLTALYSKTHDDTTNTFYNKILFYDSCDYRFSINVGCRTNILQFSDFATAENEGDIGPDYDETGHRRS